jgi:hypothetical protein
VIKDNEKAAVRRLVTDPAHKLALETILFKICGIRDECMAFGTDGARKTDYLLGRRSVGLEIARLGEEAIKTLEEAK